MVSNHSPWSTRWSNTGHFLPLCSVAVDMALCTQRRWTRFTSNQSPGVSCTITSAVVSVPLCCWARLARQPNKE